MARARKRALFDPELGELPHEARWREWMGRVEAVIFASPTPVPRETLAQLVGPECRLDELLADIQDELRARPYELVFVAGGWQHRTRGRFADAIRSARGRGDDDDDGPALTPTENLVVTAIAYLQPVTRAELSRLLGKEVSRDTIARLKRLDLVAAGPRMPAIGAPLTYVTTSAFLSLFGLASLRDLPDIEALEAAGLLERGAPVDSAPDDLDEVLGLMRDDAELSEAAAPPFED
ncbi:MAG: SMC-Scp complex subunit ScpB [Methylobacterium sp.]|uniref:SMC-Scp complex subunit ScpB n=1 Tax=Methylobacterium sp. TaxID=409 RepID=UPI0025F3FC3C|nr:SMC-Scp complex subunit ScpB [Methylobacterium sp.]MBX9934839.1 SMC-Scp complex subunit ScpB [Methylobacterium sp.]